MCGITGVFNLSGESFAKEHLIKMNRAIAHRGPDGEGYFQSNGISLAHRRLAILDLSDRAAQPMTSKDKRWTIVFNGCIYNYLELKSDLQKRNHEFISTSDTEVIVEGIASYGLSFIEKLNGMFAIGIWDDAERRLYLTRDRYGVKPLYFWFTGKTLVFASEIKSILQHPQYKVEVNYKALSEYFTFQNIFSYHTLFKGIDMLPAANTIMIDSNTTTIRHNAWWDYDFSSSKQSMSFDEAKEETERLLKQSVKRQMIADVPVGSYLSGGIDSGSIAAIASTHVSRLYTFTCGFDLSGITGVEANYDERRDAEMMANHFKTQHFEQVINAGDLNWSLPRVVYHLEDLRVGMSYPNYYISRLASKFVKVCLQGTGGDELYGGYPWRYYRVLNSISQKDFFNQYYGFWQRLVSDNDKSRLFTTDTLAKIGDHSPRDVFERVFTFNPRLKYDLPEHHIENSLYFEIKTFLPGLLLVGDKLSMANGLEERFPFLDNDLINFGQIVPIKHKLANLELQKTFNENDFGNKKRLYQDYDEGKNVLRKAMLNFIPERIINRKKQGFSAPDESWYRGENADYVRELLLNKNCLMHEFINPKFVEEILNEHINKKINHRLLIWSFLCFEWWCKIFLNKEPVDLS